MNEVRVTFRHLVCSLVALAAGLLPLGVGYGLWAFTHGDKAFWGTVGFIASALLAMGATFGLFHVLSVFWDKNPGITIWRRKPQPEFPKARVVK